MQAGVDDSRQAQVPGSKKKSLFALDYEQRHAKPQGARMCRVHKGDGLRAGHQPQPICCLNGGPLRLPWHNP
jgi:hypothetical protein